MLHLDTQLSSHTPIATMGDDSSSQSSLLAFRLWGSGQSVPKDSSLACVLKNLKPVLLTELKANRLKQLYADHWPEFGTFDFNILSDLSNFLKLNGKRSEVPYIQAF